MPRRHPLSTGRLRCARGMSALAVAGFALAPAVTRPQGAAPGACRSAVAEQQLLQRETALLGKKHAAEHAQTRAQQCAAERDPSPASARAPLRDAGTALQEQAVLVQAASDAATSGKPLAGANARAVDVAKTQGRWSEPFAMPVLGVASVLLHTGKVLFWSYDPASWMDPNHSNTGVASLWDPATGASEAIAPPENIWCGGQTLLADGRVFVAGGNLRYPNPSAPQGTTGWQGAFSTYTFNPESKTWTAQPPMAQGRWYPTTTRLADNRVVITSGFDQTGSEAVTGTVEVFTPSAAANGVGQLVSVGTHQASGLYPLQYLLGSGRMLEAGPAPSSSYLLDPATWNWSLTGGGLEGGRYLGNGILYTDSTVAPARQLVMVAGGENPPGLIPGNQWFDPAAPGTGWRSYPQWQQRRWNSNTVLLPDGTMLTVGGGAGPGQYDNPVYATELYSRPADDTSGRWAPVAQPALAAAYHSSALLLPDGTVLLSQDDRDKAGSHAAQVYSPPYLFKGARPVISSAPATATRGQTISVGMERVGATTAMLVAPGATTHGNDMHQRAIKLPVQVSGRSVTATLPASPAIAPPGHYMLFILDKAGVPSVARFIHLS